MGGQEKVESFKMFLYLPPISKLNARSKHIVADVFLWGNLHYGSIDVILPSTPDLEATLGRGERVH